MGVAVEAWHIHQPPAMNWRSCTDQAVCVGDSLWDIRAAARAGLQCIGVQSGGIDRKLLEAEGAAVVFEGPAHLSTNLANTSIGRLAEGAMPAS